MEKNLGLLEKTGTLHLRVGVGIEFSGQLNVACELTGLEMMASSCLLLNALASASAPYGEACSVTPWQVGGSQATMCLEVLAIHYTRPTAQCGIGLPRDTSR